MKVIDKIRQIRSMKNISQEYMAIVLGMDTSNYHRLEKGISPLSVDRLEAISVALGIPMAELIIYGEKENIPSASDKKNPDYYLEHLEEEISFLRKQLQEKETQLNRLLTNKDDSGTPANPSRNNHRA
jgi:transcriptional regulator with XRE-family HTH domain